MKKISKSEMVRLVEAHLTENYEMRYNLLSKKIEVRAKGEERTGFQPLTEKKLNSMVRRARVELEGVTDVRRHVEEYVNSEDIQQYDPIRDWLHGLPGWDGRNRVAEVLGQIPGMGAEQLYWIHLWMRSTVAHWLGMDTLHGNECVPTLVGAQGCGKSTWCRRLLPAELRSYFLDHVNLSNKNDKEMALTNNLLVNLDELDQIKAGQQAELKQMLSKVRVNGRVIYGRDQQDRTRYASFVATTNNLHPLRDTTGSRRYICVRIPDGTLIDNDTTIDYRQLYAQLVYEVEEQQLRYWFTNEETMAIQQANAQFQQEQDLDSMIEVCFRAPGKAEQGQMVSVSEMADILKRQFPLLQQHKALYIQLGMKLKSHGFEKKETARGSYYCVVRKVAA